MQVTLYINLLCVLLACWLFVWLNNRVLQPARLARFRYRLFSLRDRLALQALRGNASSNSEEYQFVIQVINATIKNAENCDPFEVAKFYLGMGRNENVRKRLDEILRLREKCMGHEVYKEVLTNYFEISDDLFLFNLFPRFLFGFFRRVGRLSSITRQRLSSLYQANSFIKSQLSLAKSERV